MRAKLIAAPPREERLIQARDRVGKMIDNAADTVKGTIGTEKRRARRR